VNAMSTYRFLQDSYINNVYYQAGTIASTSDVGGTLPVGWVPGPAVDPQDSPATTAFLNAGPQAPVLARSQWNGIIVNGPSTYWKATALSFGTLWQLVGPSGNVGSPVLN
jgi:hypothetical protein